MYPELYHTTGFVVYSYGFFIMVGALIAFFYARHEAAKIKISTEQTAEMIVYIFIASYIGGKVFLWFEDWDYYTRHPLQMIQPSGSGFVFYGSFIFAVVTLFFFFRLHKMNTRVMFDIVAIGGSIVHGFGKIGCFMAGCCYGKPSESATGVVFTDPLSSARPLDVPLYPVQLYDAAIIFSCTFLLLHLRDRNLLTGKLAFVYSTWYATGRFFTEFLRGDEDRSYLFNGLLSQNQLISLLIIMACTVLLIFIHRRHVHEQPEHTG